MHRVLAFVRLLFGLALLLCLQAIIVFASQPSGTSIDQAISEMRLWTRDSLMSASRSLDAPIAAAVQGNNITLAGDLRIIRGRIEQRLGDREAARTFFLLSLADHRSKASTGQTVALTELALQEFESGEPTKARSYVDEALSISKTATSTIHKAYAHFAAAELAYFDSDVDRSQTFYLSALELFDTSDPEAVIRTRLGLGYLQLRRDNNREGYEQFKLANELAISIGDLRSQAITEKAIGSSLNNLNQKQAALEMYTAAERRFPPDLDRTEHAILLNGIGSIYSYYRNWTEARRHKSKAVELFTDDGAVYGLIATLSDLASITFKTGDEKTAIQYLDRSKKITMQAGNKLHLALTFEEFGNIFHAKRLYRDAIENFERAAKTYEQIKNARRAAEVYCTMGQIMSETNGPTRADEYFKLAESKSERVRDSFVVAEIAFQRAKAYRRIGDIRSAIGSLFRSLDITFDLSDEIADTRLQNSFRDSVFERIELFLDLSIELLPYDPQIAEHSLAVVESFRMRGLASDIRFSRATSATPSDASRDDLRDRETIMLLQLDRSLDDLSIAAAKNDAEAMNAADTEIAELRNKLGVVRAQMRTSDPMYTLLRETPFFDPVSFRLKEIDDETVVLNYMLGEKQSLLWVTDTRGVELHILPARRVIVELAARLDEAIKPLRLDAANSFSDLNAKQTVAAEQVKQLSSELSRVLLSPARSQQRGKRILIVPDRGISKLSFAMLPPPDGSAEFLVQTNEIGYLPSLSSLPIIRAAGRTRASRDPEALVIADPIYGEADTGEFPDLPGSRIEAQKVIESIGSASTTQLIGADANRTRLYDVSSRGFGLLHFAVHGVVDTDRTELTGLALSNAGRSGYRRSETMFGLQDIFTTRIAADLVVLSGCETTIGRETRVDSPQSLASAFIQTGSDTVVSSFWKVDDEATSELMGSMYDSLAKSNLTPAESLRSAQLALIKEDRFAKPYYWAAFAAHGEYSKKLNLGRRVHQTVVFAVLAAVCALFLILFVKFKRRLG